MMWAVPASVAVLATVTAVGVALMADADAELPERDASELIAALTRADDVPLAGTIVHSADLGLPEAPDLTAQSGSPLSLLTGATTARVWYAAPDTYRVAVYGELSETDLVRDGEDIWYWNSEENRVLHYAMSDTAAAAGSGAGSQTAPESSGQDSGEGAAGDAPEGKGAESTSPMPEASADMLAEYVLQLLEPSTEVEADGTVTVAGRAAYELVFRPRDDTSLVDSVRVAIDAAHGVPLRVQLHDTAGGDPAAEVGYTSISFDEPDRSAFEFSPPPDAEVEEMGAGSWLAWEATSPGLGHWHLGDGFDEKLGADLDADVAGSGWSSVLVVSGVDFDELLAAFEDSVAGTPHEVGDLADAMDEMEEVSGPYGEGLAFETRLWSVLYVDDGRLLAGAVSLETLEKAAAAR
ncbi:hypothetical protein EF847_13200 [Actinobacteria bacterium YIM 96077]|uniref:DUF2092 domain-containing protein n=2 Tax=Phytoactinopolyspora halophila TaxID=1981511 RepID=A0A329QP85_9ACTN|nr:hypothetical protein EF847_13200 [Actinobacteria bacterium YIM 96077]RAW12438.1 hypothetical protein DPM12_14845 [Phytoactinopolyspora halophila]